MKRLARMIRVRIYSAIASRIVATCEADEVPSFSQRQPRPEHVISGRQSVLVISRSMFVSVALVSATALFTAPYPAKALQAAAQSGQATWKDQAESDLYQAISKETDAQKKIALFQQWKEKYPSSQMGAYFLPQYVQGIQLLAAPIGTLFTTGRPDAAKTGD